MSDILFFNNTHSWINFPKEELGDPLNEYWTFMAYNFIEYGLVDRVCYFLHQNSAYNNIKLEFDKGMIVLIHSENPISYMNNYDGGYVYFWGASYDQNTWNAFSKLNADKFLICDPMFNGIYGSQNNINSKLWHFAMPEGLGFEHAHIKRVLPSEIPVEPNRYISKTFLDISDFNVSKEYDWISINSFDPRKDHINFLKSLYHSEAKKSSWVYCCPRTKS